MKNQSTNLNFLSEFSGKDHLVPSLIKSAAILMVSIPHFLMAQYIRIDSAASGSSMCSDGQGGAFVLWSHRGEAIYLKHYDSTGRSLASDSTSFANTEATVEPGIARGTTHNVVIWTDRAYVWTFNTYIVGAIFASNNVESKIYFQPQEPRYDVLRYAPDVHFITDTTFLIAWCESNVGTFVWGQFYSISGQKIGKNFILIDSSSVVTPGASRIVFHQGEGSFILVTQADSSGIQVIQGRKFDLTGKQVGPFFRITEENTSHDVRSAVAEDAEGNFLVAWTIRWDNISRHEWRWYSKEGTPLTEVEPLTALDTLYNYTDLNATIDKKGQTVLVWNQQTSGTPYRVKAFGRCYAAGSHVPMGNTFQISTDTTSDIDLLPCVVADHGVIFATWLPMPDGINGRILKFSDVTAVGSEEPQSTAQPESFHLYQNYPNPFNPSTTIRFSLSMHAEVALIIYDLLGRTQCELLNRQMNPGSYSVQWDGKNQYGISLPSGVYIAQLKVGNNVQARKLLLVK